MNHRAYIASGIIEDYCLGTLSEEESKAVEERAQRYPEIKREIDAFMYTLERYALDSAHNNAEHIRNKTISGWSMKQTLMRSLY